MSDNREKRIKVICDNIERMEIMLRDMRLTAQELLVRIEREDPIHEKSGLYEQLFEQIATFGDYYARSQVMQAFVFSLMSNFNAQKS